MKKDEVIKKIESLSNEMKYLNINNTKDEMKYLNLRKEQKKLVDGFDGMTLTLVGILRIIKRFSEYED